MKRTVFELEENIGLMVAALIIGLFCLFYTRKAKWTGKDWGLLSFSLLNFALDTLWWWRRLHFWFTDFYFMLGSQQMKLTIFFIASLVSFILLIKNRVKRLHANKEMKYH